MGQISAREPGVVGDLHLHFENTFASIIVDLHHVHPSSNSVWHTSQKPKGKAVLYVSDSMATIHHGEPSFELYDEVVSESNGRIVNSEGKLSWLFYYPD